MAMAIGDADITKGKLTSNPEPVVDADGVRARGKSPGMNWSTPS